MKSINEIYLRRKNKVLISEGQAGVYHFPEVIGAMLSNLESLGFTFTENLIKRLLLMSRQGLIDLYNEILPILQEMVGAHKTFEPMYPNFPKQVMKASDAELYINAIIHYWTLWLPAYEKKERAPLWKNKVELRFIDLGTDEEFKQIFTDILSSKTSISQTDKEDVEWCAYHYDFLGALPTEIPLKENVALVAVLALKYLPYPKELLAFYVKTSTDVLRIAVAMSGGDISLAEPCKFKNFTRAERRLLLGLLDGLSGEADDLAEDMYRWEERWKRLAHKLHPFEKKNGYCSLSRSAFDIFLNGYKDTTSTRLERYIQKGNVENAVDILKHRAGDFARKLNVLLSRSLSDWQREFILGEFEKVADKVSTPVLLQVMDYFKHRQDLLPKLRAFFPKGNVAKVFAKENGSMKILDDWVSYSACVICRNTLIERFRNLPALGNVYLDEKLKNYTVPFSQRSASKALKTVSRGSKIELPEGSTLRFFIWWRDQMKREVTQEDPWEYYDGRTDIDLSAVALDENFKYIGNVAYYDLNNDLGCHSGDITSAPNGASEFIDIKIKKALEQGYRYIVMCVNSYSGQNFKNLPECFAGLMIRSKPNSGEIFEPATVENKFDLTSDTKMVIPMVIDLKERTMTWMDLGVTKLDWGSHVWGERSKIELMVEAMATMNRPNLYDLFEMHAIARGKSIFKDDGSGNWEINMINDDTIFTSKSFGVIEGREIITPYDIDKISSEYLV